jgi:putative endonuclease
MKTRPARAAKMKWTVYILECADTTLYTGITTDIRRRMDEHHSGRGAKYTRRRGPLLVRYTELRRTRSAALKREAAIKSMTRSAKLALMAASPLNSPPVDRTRPAVQASPTPFRRGQHPAGRDSARP